MSRALVKGIVFVLSCYSMTCLLTYSWLITQRMLAVDKLFSSGLHVVTLLLKAFTQCQLDC